MFEFRNVSLRNAKRRFALQVLLVLASLIANRESIASSSVNHCSAVGRNRAGQPLPDLSPLEQLRQPRPNSCSLADPNSRPVGPSPTLSPEMEATVAATQDTAFMELLRTKVLARTMSSKTDALMIQHCFENDRRLSPFYQVLRGLPEDAQTRQCPRIRNWVNSQTARLPELRQNLALQDSSRRTDTFAVNNMRSEKITTAISLPHGSLALQSLSEAETTAAVAEYDSWINSVEGNPRNGAFSGSQPLTLARRQRVERERQARRQAANRILAENRLLMHFDSADTSNAAILRAGRNLEQQADSFLAELREMSRDLTGNSALKLLSYSEAVEEVVRENPALCAAANRRLEALSNIETRDLVISGGIVLGAGSLCTMGFLMPTWCFGLVASTVAGYHFWGTRNEYRAQVAAFETTSASGRSLVNSIENLDNAELNVFIAGAMVVVPYEAALGKAWVSATTRVPAFGRVVERVNSRVGVDGPAVVGRYFDRFRRAIDETPP